MDRIYIKAGQFVGHEQMAQISPGEGPARVARAAFFYGALILGKARVSQVHLACGGKESPIACKPRWDNTVEHIDASLHAFKEVFGHTYAHHVPRFLLW